ncbi:thiamine pyrophosphate-dependent dehydrogenase E1 component subunit alpha [Micromonospora tulbaghiae]|uniref:thiamine pyrophosphate-dependent dehydrogenase E1 component subunit alpha n=1 Tax=Micromonospora tulbaghiae TaxID=479978 RepID=UPI0036549156
MNGALASTPPGPVEAAPGALTDDDLARLLLIRHFERSLLDLFAAGEVSGTTHTCLGQEYIPVALQTLTTPAFVFSNHRGHGHYLAQFGDPAGLLAEILGREGAVCGGYGGSQHLYREGFCSTGVQGESVPAALGVALHLRRTGKPGLVVAYIGDGTWGQGVVYEALNMAQLWSAPLLLAVENNGIAQSTPTERAMAGSIAGRAAAFGVRYEGVESTCIPTIRRQLAGALAETRCGAGPLVIEFRTERLGPHSKGDDFRPAEYLAGLADWDWYTRYAARYPAQFAEIDARQRQLIESVVRDVLARPLAAGAVR